MSLEVCTDSLYTVMADFIQVQANEEYSSTVAGWQYAHMYLRCHIGHKKDRADKTAK